MASKKKKPVLVYDGKCGLCKMCVHYAMAATGEKVAYEPFQKAAKKYTKIPLKTFKKSIQLIESDGKVYSEADAAFRAMSYGGGWLWRLSAWKYKRIPGFAPLSEWFYRRVANNRPFFARVTNFLWGREPEPPRYELLRSLFIKIVGFVYLFAFVSFGVQITGLIGSEGILPLKDFLAQVTSQVGSAGYYFVPTLFWLSSSDVMLKLLPMLGGALALMLIFGFAERIALFVLFFLYLSLVSAGQVFMGFQWDILLLEVGFLTFLFSLAPGFIWLLRWLLFRLVFMSGVVKLVSGDPNWRNLTALNYHYQTQPLPNTLAWLMHQLPEGFQKFSVGVMFIIQLIVPFLLFAPRRIRFAAGGLIALLEVLIMVTGNYNFFNVLTLALCLLVMDDQLLPHVLPKRLTKGLRKLTGFKPSQIRNVIFGILTALILFVSGALVIRPFTGTVLPAATPLLRAIAPLHLINHYGLFAVMTIRRPEVIIEGSNDQEEWLEYEFKYKPGDPAKRPRWIIPHQPRLDWQMWFAALGSYQSNRWFVSFTKTLLDGSPDVLRLLAVNPFPDEPPKFIRATVYDYEFTDFKALRETGHWWERGELLGTYLPAVGLENFEKPASIDDN